MVGLDTRKAAFIMLKEREAELRQPAIRPDDPPRGEPLPATVADLLQRKADARYANHLKRAASREARKSAAPVA
jgi:hypothetical protein